MAELTLAGKTIQVNDEGYLLNASDWSVEIAHAMAAEYEITLTDKHIALLQFLRDKQAAGESLTIRRIGTSGICDIKEFYQLFPGGPLKISSRLAGIPKPVSCV